jgi:FKBP-type peptidyl-prolyl cis-trans isomerase 2
MIKKNDFVEIEFTGYVNNQIFDTTNIKDSEKMGLKIKDLKPLCISVGNQMLVEGFDEDINGKEIGKEYIIEIKPEKAFGKRSHSMIKTYSINNFQKQNVSPYPGMTLQLDNLIARVISVNGGRVMIDFNNPLAGRKITYKYKIKKLITDEKDKINSLQDFFFKKRFDFDIKDKKVVFKDQEIKNLLEIMSTKFKDITGLDFMMDIKIAESIVKDGNL